ASPRNGEPVIKRNSARTFSSVAGEKLTSCKLFSGVDADNFGSGEKLPELIGGANAPSASAGNKSAEFCNLSSSFCLRAELKLLKSMFVPLNVARSRKLRWLKLVAQTRIELIGATLCWSRRRQPNRAVKTKSAAP